MRRNEEGTTRERERERVAGEVKGGCIMILIHLLLAAAVT